MANELIETTDFDTMKVKAAQWRSDKPQIAQTLSGGTEQINLTGATAAVSNGLDLLADLQDASEKLRQEIEAMQVHIRIHY